MALQALKQVVQLPLAVLLNEMPAPNTKAATTAQRMILDFDRSALMPFNFMPFNFMLFNFMLFNFRPFNFRPFNFRPFNFRLFNFMLFNFMFAFSWQVR